jgi:hypothetical protein
MAELSWLLQKQITKHSQEERSPSRSQVSPVRQSPMPFRKCLTNLFSPPPNPDPDAKAALVRTSLFLFLFLLYIYKEAHTDAEN